MNARDPLAALGEALAGIAGITPDPTAQGEALLGLHTAQLALAEAFSKVRRSVDGYVSPERVSAADRAIRAARMAYYLAEALLNPTKPDEIERTGLNLIDEADRVLSRVEGKQGIEDLALIELVRTVKQAAHCGRSNVALEAWNHGYPEYATRLDSATFDQAVAAWPGENARQRWDAIHSLAVKAGVISRAKSSDSIRKDWERWSSSQ